MSMMHFFPLSYDSNCQKVHQSVSNEQRSSNPQTYPLLLSPRSTPPQTSRLSLMSSLTPSQLCLNSKHLNLCRVAPRFHCWLLLNRLNRSPTFPRFAPSPPFYRGQA